MDPERAPVYDLLNEFEKIFFGVVVGGAISVEPFFGVVLIQFFQEIEGGFLDHGRALVQVGYFADSFSGAFHNDVLQVGPLSAQRVDGFYQSRAQTVEFIPVEAFGFLH